jgi:DNA repair protein RadA
MVKKEIEEEEENISEIDDLPGVGAMTADKLKDAGYDTVMSIAVAPTSELSEASGMSVASATKAQIAARNAMDMGFITGTELVEKRKNIERITTGSESFDELLGGGIETQSITESYGEFGSGKSQLAMMLAITCQLPKKDGGLNKDVLFIDTENTFRPERITQMCETRGLNPKKILSRIMVARAYTSDHQMLLVDKIDEVINKHEKKIGLVIVDSLMSLFRSEYAGRGTLAVRQQKLNRHLHSLQRAADKHNLAIYVTNQVQSNPAIFFGNPTKAIGGHILGHASQFRIYLRKGKAGKRVARLVDSPYLPEGEIIFNITEKGIEEA